MKVLFVTPELAPWVKSGGLGEVAHALPVALRRAGVDARILVPAYPALTATFGRARLLVEWSNPGGRLPPVRVLDAGPMADVPLLLVDCPRLFDRPGSAYGDAMGQDFGDNDLRFGLLSRVAAWLGCADTPLDWRPDIVHCNDWPAGMAAAWLHFARAPKAACIMTVHNMAFQGIYPFSTLAALGLPPEAFAVEGVEFWGQVSFMKAGLHYADHITTVSPRYAEEIQSEEFGYGFAGLLRWRSGELTGILNGIDTRAWDPATDPHLARHYEYAHLRGKEANRSALRQRFGLAPDLPGPLLGSVSRLTHQKGLDLVAEIADEIANLPAQLVVLGTGDKGIEAALLAAAARNPQRMAVRIGFDESLAHLIEAGSDLFLMPSRFEPCGLNQMYSLRYGTPPVVRATGGLADTVIDADSVSGAPRANGFAFEEASGAALLATLRRAVEVWQDRTRWRALLRNGMRADFGWEPAATRYRTLYEKLRNRALTRSRAAPGE